MKLLPMPLAGLNGQQLNNSLGNPIGNPIGMWGPELLWRYQQSSPPSPLSELKTQLPAQLSPDPRVWNRDDVAVFLQFCEREFDLPKFDLDAFQMNGKALCLLSKADLAERVPGAGDVLHNVLQMLIRELQCMHKHLPTSPVTPTSRYPFSPHSQPPTPNWTLLAPPDSPFHNAHFQHLMAAQSNSVTLSPAPSTDSSQGRSPPTHQNELLLQQQQHQLGLAGIGAAASLASVGFAAAQQQHHHQQQQQQQQQQQHQQQQQQHHQQQQSSMNGTSSTHSDSDEDSNYSDKKHHSMLQHHHQLNSSAQTNGRNNNNNGVTPMQHDQLQSNNSPPPTPLSKDAPLTLTQQITNVVNSWSVQKSELAASNGAIAVAAAGQQQLQQQQQQQLGSGGSSSVSSNSSNSSNSAPSTPSYLSVKREFFSDTTSAAEPNTNGRLLWDFLQQLLNDNAQRYAHFISWKTRETGVFKIVDPAGLAKLWGIQKNHLSMNYDKMSRALRYYYRVNILRKVQGERHCYQFLRNPTELKSIKNISLLRQSTASNNAPASAASTTNTTDSKHSVNATMHMQHQQQQSTQHPSHLPHPLQLHHPHHPHGLHTLPLPLSLSGPNMSPPPSSPRVLALNGAFHHLSTSSPVVPHAPMVFPPLAAVDQQRQSVSPLHQQQQQHLQHLHQQHQLQAQHQQQLHHQQLQQHQLQQHHQQQQQQQQQQQHQQSTASSLADSDDFKMEPNIDVDGEEEDDDVLPTDLSVGPSKYKPEQQAPASPSAMSAGTADCYPLIRNANGLTTIRLISQQSASASAADYPHQVPVSSTSPASQRSSYSPAATASPAKSVDDDSSPDQDAQMPTDLRK